jgi:hypothetical protein
MATITTAATLTFIAVIMAGTVGHTFRMAITAAGARGFIATL